MKNADKYLGETDPDVNDFHSRDWFYSKTLVIQMIKQAQKDAYNEALDDAAENATATYNDYEDFINGKEHYIVDKESILKLKLI